MKYFFISIFLFAFFVVKAQNTDQISALAMINKHLNVVGGREKWQNIKNIIKKSLITKYNGEQTQIIDYVQGKDRRIDVIKPDSTKTVYFYQKNSVTKCFYGKDGKIRCEIADRMNNDYPIMLFSSYFCFFAEKDLLLGIEDWEENEFLQYGIVKIQGSRHNPQAFVRFISKIIFFYNQT